MLLVFNMFITSTIHKEKFSLTFLEKINVIAHPQASVALIYHMKTSEMFWCRSRNSSGPLAPVFLFVLKDLFLKIFTWKRITISGHPFAICCFRIALN